jgi:dihydroorotase
MLNTQVLRRALEYAATYDITVFIHAEDPWLANNGCAHEGAIATRMGLPGIPAAAETAAVAQHLALIEQTGVRAHFCRLTTSRAIQMIARAQYDGLPITADVAIPYLYMSEMDISGFDSLCHVLPPFRTQSDRDGLRAGVARGTISTICSDHQPHEADAKQNPFPSTEPGISGLDTLLGLTLKLVDDNLLTLSEALERVTIGPARVLGLDKSGVGSLTPGGVADIAVIDLEAPWRVEPLAMTSRGLNTPFMGWELKGQVSHTLVDGRMAYERDKTA